MRIEEDINQIMNAMTELLPIEVQEGKEEFKIKYKGIKRAFVINKEEFNEHIKRYENMKFQGTLLYSNNYYENLVQFRRGSGSYFMTNSNLGVKDKVNSIKYEISPPSHEYVIYCITELYRIYADKEIHLLLDFFPEWRLKRKIFGEQAVDVNFFDFLAKNVLGKTVKISSSDSLKVDYLAKMKDAYLYNICFNLNLPVVEIKSFQEIFGSRGIRSFRNRLTIDNLEPPKLFYIPELVNHYQIAMSSDNSAYEYLSFYHIIEHFFELVYKKDLIKKVKSELTKPSFSCNRDSDIDKIIEITRNSIKKIKEENTIIDEESALKLTLIEFVDLDELRIDLQNYDPDLLNYYRDNAVSFSYGDSFNFNDSPDIVYKKLASRLYKTRNSIVHSKKSNKQIYNHLKDEKMLSKEIPLMRLIAEQIIHNSSKIIELR